MNMKQYLIRLFKIKTYENENRLLQARYEGALETLDIAQGQVEMFKNMVDALEEENRRLKELNEDPVQYVCELTEEMFNLRDGIQRKVNRARSEGYREAFAKMGLFVLEAKEQGRRLYYDSDTLECVEVIPDDDLVQICEDCEISLDDLEDVM